MLRRFMLYCVMSWFVMMQYMKLEYIVHVLLQYKWVQSNKQLSDKSCRLCCGGNLHIWPYCFTMLSNSSLPQSSIAPRVEDVHQ